MKSMLERLRASRLASTFTILGTLSAGILIGSVAVHGVRGNETQTDSTDATPLKIPAPATLSPTVPPCGGDDDGQDAQRPDQNFQDFFNRFFGGQGGGGGMPDQGDQKRES